MKIVRGAAPIVLLLYLKFRHFLFSSKVSSLASQNQNPSSIFHIFTVSKPSHLLVAFTFNIIVALLLLGTFNPFSFSNISSSPTFELSNSFSYNDSYVHLPPPIIDTMKEGDDHNKNDNEFVPRLVYVRYKQIGDHDQNHGDEPVDDAYMADGEDGFGEDDLNKRVEDFIAANTKKWKDEQVNEGLFYKRNFSAFA